VSVPEVRATKEETAPMISWLCDLSASAAEEGGLVEQRGLVAWEIRALNFLATL
jgi:hypothetical protein